LTRTTAILATLFVILAIALAFVSAKRGTPAAIDDSLQRTAPAVQQTVPAQPETSTAPRKDIVAPESEVPLDK
jgi:preprotein translocase subunit SecG